MQKKIIALAVAGLVSGAAFAQTNVTIYGVADAAYIYSKSDDNKFAGIDSGGWSGGRIGFTGEEALGNGLKAIFTYEFGTSIDENVSLNSTRQAFVGLSGGFGSVTLGRQYAPAGSWFGATSSNDVTGVNVTNLALGSYFVIMDTGGNSRWNNSISYNSPKFSGLDFRVIYSFGEKVGAYLDRETGESVSHDTTDGGKFAVGARYANGPVYLTAMYHMRKDSEDTLIDDGVKSWAIGGSYDFNVVKVFANYAHQKFDEDSGDNSNKQILASVGLNFPVTKVSNVHFEYMQFKNKAFDDDNKAKGFSAGYYHDLSKRTRLYANVSRVDNDENVTWGFSKTVLGDETNTNFQVGIRHLF